MVKFNIMDGCYFCIYMPGFIFTGYCFKNPIGLRTDASNTGCGAVLLQIVDDNEQPEATTSREFGVDSS